MTQAKKKEEEARKAAEEKAQKAEEQAKRAAELEAQIAAAQAEKDAAEKQIKLSADPEYTRFKFMFEQWQQNMSALVEQISKLDADKQEKVKQAIRKVWEVSGL
jgi:predicted  nucleic acid-binding Zn-ribbon protein